MGILDRYITKKFISILGGFLFFLAFIVMIVDVQSKAPRIEESPYSIGYFLLHFYPYWILYLIITFLSVAVFISIIFFTSKMANNTEIVAIISSGVSFHRFAMPYFAIAGFLMVITLIINHFILPWANVKKNELIVYTFNAQNQKKYLSTTSISSQISENEYIFIQQYSPSQYKGESYQYQKFHKGKLVYQIIADSIKWDKTAKNFQLSKFLKKNIKSDNSEILQNGDKKTQDFQMPPEELFPNNLQAENKTTPDLLDFIHRERVKGNQNLNTYLNELHSRTSMPISIFILNILALSLSSQKKRGGIGLNLAVGIALAFTFIFSFEVFKILSVNQIISPLLAVWIPNIIFGILSLYLYIKRANE